MAPGNATRSRLFTGHVTARQVMQAFGRDAWEATPNGLKIKDGKRRLMRREDFEDAIPLIYVGRAKVRAVMVFDNNYYANDPRSASHLDIAI